MYTITVKAGKTGIIKTILLIILLIVFTIGLYILFSFFDSIFSPESAAASILIVIFVAAYFIFKPFFSKYVYEFSSNGLKIGRLTLGRLTKEIVIDSASIISVEKGKGGIRLYPAGTVPYTVKTKDKLYTIAPDNMLLNLLQHKNFTDAYIEENFEKMTENIRQLVKIPSVKGPAEPGMPFGKPCADALEYVLDLCKDAGFRTRNLDNYCGWAEAGEGKRLIAVLCHLDVVPAGEGWKYAPFSGEIVDGNIFGRGVVDDKGPAIAAIYALKAVVADGIQGDCRIRLIFGCDEESDWQCMERYSRTEEMPEMAFTPDAEYPVIITEKGIVHYALHAALEEGDYQLYLNGGLRPNMVPEKARATVIGNIDKLFLKLNEYNVHDEGICFSAEGNTLTIEATGVAAHGSTPEKGTNAFFRLFKFLDHLQLSGSQGEFVSTMVKLFVDKTDGSGVSLKLEDDISGPLTLNLGMCFIGKNDVYPEMQDDSCRVIIDVRYPASKTLGDISARLESALPPTWECEILHQQAPHHVDKDSLLVKTLLNVYSVYTGRNDPPIAIGGGTYARTLPQRAVGFGVQLPGRPDMAHKPDESIALDDLKLSSKMFAAALKQLAVQS